MAKQVVKEAIKPKVNKEARAAADLVLRGLFYKAYTEGNVSWGYSRENREEGKKAYNSLQNYRAKVRRNPIMKADEWKVIGQVRLSYADKGKNSRITMTRVSVEVSPITQAALNLLDNPEIGLIDLEFPDSLLPETIAKGE